ncbi:glycosyltransferase family 2 protein [Calycomorphotria hydatis]|uniref:Chondroitin synthase n=1 Tax=Calycomorphotria hydatis TaxID=2528027 RepID=A0A517T4W3_9PLAN|nr:glycosyltransferase family 2 protein [Calycomorphotria hydatis]QDT63417.1 Chondroitin synthase [Calycomorphotria hydatis]
MSLRRAIFRPWVPLRYWRQHAPRVWSPLQDSNDAVKPENPPRISIVTPSYNQAEFLGRTIESVLGQNYPALEYVVRDGASTDGSVEIIESYSDQLTRWVSEPDDGQADAIVKGFSESTGEIMGWLNSDDLLLPGTLNTVANYFQQHPEVDAVYGNRVMIDADDREVGRWVLPPHNSRVLRWFDYVPQETLFWRRELWDRVGGIDPSFRFALDWDLLLRFLDAGAKFAHLPKFLGAFRVHDDQKSIAWAQKVGKPEVKKLRLKHLGFAPKPIYVGLRCSGYLFSHIARDRWYYLTNSATAANQSSS